HLRMWSETGKGQFCSGIHVAAPRQSPACGISHVLKNPRTDEAPGGATGSFERRHFWRQHSVAVNGGNRAIVAAVVGLGDLRRALVADAVRADRESVGQALRGGRRAGGIVVAAGEGCRGAEGGGRDESSGEGGGEGLGHSRNPGSVLGGNG